MPLEDDFCDIIKKARIGQAWSVADVARMTGLPGGDITALERGVRPPDCIEVRALAKALGLRPGPLEQIAIEKWDRSHNLRWPGGERYMDRSMARVQGYCP